MYSIEIPLRANLKGAMRISYSSISRIITGVETARTQQKRRPRTVLHTLTHLSVLLLLRFLLFFLQCPLGSVAAASDHVRRSFLFHLLSFLSRSIEYYNE